MRTVLLGLVLMLGTNGDPVAPPDTVTRSGRVLLLSEVLKSKNVSADPETIAKQVVLVESDGMVTPLISNEASRALFLDEHLRDRKTEIVARKPAGLPYFQVVLFRVEEAGILRIPEYYCDVCSIAVRFPQTCPCCQGPMELRMRPENR